MFFLGRNFVSRLICTLKSKKPKLFQKTQGFFQPGYQVGFDGFAKLISDLQK